MERGIPERGCLQDMAKSYLFLYEARGMKGFVDLGTVTGEAGVGGARVSALRPTDAGLALLRVLWALGPGTTREVHRAWERERGTVAYTTALKLLQVMHDKGLVVRDTSRRSHVYAPAHDQQVVQGSLVTDLVNKAFGGSTVELVLRARSDRRIHADDPARIRALPDRLEEDPR